MFEHIGSTNLHGALSPLRLQPFVFNIVSDLSFLFAEFSSYLRYMPFLEAMNSFEAYAFANSTSSAQYKSFVEEFISKTCQRLSLTETRSIVQREVFARTFADANEEIAAYYEQFAKESTVVVTAIAQEIARRVQVENINNEQTGMPSSDSLKPSTQSEDGGTNIQDEQEKVECEGNPASSSNMQSAAGQEIPDRMQVETVKNHLSVAPSNASSSASVDRTGGQNKITKSEAKSSATKHSHVSEDHQDTGRNDVSLAAAENVRKVSKHSDLENTPSLNVEDAASSSLAQVTQTLSAEHTHGTEIHNRLEEHCLPGLSSEVAEKSRNVSSTNAPQSNHTLKIQNVTSSPLAPNTPGAHDQDAPTDMSLEDVEKYREVSAHNAPQSRLSLPAENIPGPSLSEEAQPCSADPAHGAQTIQRSNEGLIDAPAPSTAKTQDKEGTTTGKASHIINKWTTRKRAPSNQLAPAQVNVFSDPNMTEAKKRRLQNLMDEWPVSIGRRAAVTQAIKETLKSKYFERQFSTIWRGNHSNFSCCLLFAFRILQQLRVSDSGSEDTDVRSRCFPDLPEYPAVLWACEGHDTVRRRSREPSGGRRALENDVADTSKAKGRQQRLNAVFAEAVWRFLEQGGRMVLEKALELNRK